MAEKYVPFYTGDDLSALAQFEQIAASQESLAAEMGEGTTDPGSILGLTQVQRDYSTPEVIAGGLTTTTDWPMVPMIDKRDVITEQALPGQFAGQEYAWEFPDATTTFMYWRGFIPRGVSPNARASVNWHWTGSPAAGLFPNIPGIGYANDVFWEFYWSVSYLTSPNNWSLNLNTAWGRDISVPYDGQWTGLSNPNFPVGNTPKTQAITTFTSIAQRPTYHMTVIDIDTRLSIFGATVFLRVRRLGGNAADTWAYDAFGLGATISVDKQGIGQVLAVQAL